MASKRKHGLTGPGTMRPGRGIAAPRSKVPRKMLKPTYWKVVAAQQAIASAWAGRSGT